jgi:hypothetical protein
MVSQPGLSVDSTEDLEWEIRQVVLGNAVAEVVYGNITRQVIVGRDHFRGRVCDIDCCSARR